MMLGGMEIPEPPAGWVYIDAVVLIKCVDADGKTRYKEMRSTNLPAVEALGMVSTYTDTLRNQIMRSATTD